MAKKEAKTVKIDLKQKQPSVISPKAKYIALGIYAFIAAVLTFPLIFRMNSTVYGIYDHISTDLFAAIHLYFWWIKYSLITLKIWPTFSPLLAAPFGSPVYFTNFTGFVHVPFSALFGHIFSYNLTILFNLTVSGLGMYFLVTHVTKNTGAGFIAGIIYAFCPNMLVRSYTTFDTTQVQWIPLYTLFLIKFVENRTWNNILLAGMFLAFNILFTFPYYLVYLPVHTVVLVLVYAVWHMWSEKQGISGLVKDITTSEGLKSWIKVTATLCMVIVLFTIYYSTIIGGTEGVTSVKTRTIAELEDLSLTPTDYLMPHPRSALLKGNIKESYWEAKRPRKDPDSFVAYIGYIALALAALGLIRGKRGIFKWLFLACALVAFWSTLGPRLFGLPTPSGLMFMFVNFARRILIYKVFVQMGIAGLAGIGTVYILSLVKSRVGKLTFLSLINVCILLEYSLVPPALSVDLRYNPEIYQKIKELPDDTTLIEVPMRRNNGNLYQGYAYYQTVHQKPLFNFNFGLSKVPERLRPFYEQMEVPLEAQEYANLAVLRYLGVTHLTYHWHIGASRVIFRSFAAPGLGYLTDKGSVHGNIEGLNRVYTCNRIPWKGDYQGPFDYTFADLYEISAEPCPVALTFDYQNPYNQVPGMIDRDGILEYGWASALIDTTHTFFYPLAEGDRLIRLLRQGGRVTVINISDSPVDCNISFAAVSADSNRVIEAKWNEDLLIEQFMIGPEPVRCTVRGLHIDSKGTGVLSLWSTCDAFLYSVNIGNREVKLPANAVLFDFRVVTGKEL